MDSVQRLNPAAMNSVHGVLEGPTKHIKGEKNTGIYLPTEFFNLKTAMNIDRKQTGYVYVVQI